MNIIEKEITYTIPDIFGGTTTDEQKTQTSSYKGADEFYILIDDNNKVVGENGILPAEDSEILDSWKDDCTPIKVNAEQEPVLALLFANLLDNEEEDDGIEEEESDQPEEKFYYVNGSDEAFFSHAIPIDIVHVFDKDNIFYEDEKFIIPFMDLSQDDEMSFEVRKQDDLEFLEEYIQNNDLTQEQKQLIDEYKKDLDKVPEIYKDWPEYLWPMPPLPFEDEDDNEEEDIGQDEDDSEIQ